MTIEKQREGDKLTVSLKGRLNTSTSPQLEEALKDQLDDIHDLTLDLEGLEYISSAGLRILLLLQKTMNKQGTMKVVHVSEMVMDVFEVSGFTNVLTIE